MFSSHEVTAWRNKKLNLYLDALLFLLTHYTHARNDVTVILKQITKETFANLNHIKINWKTFTNFFNIKYFVNFIHHGEYMYYVSF